MLSYLTTRRRTSGSVAVTTADKLWEQNDKLIAAYATDNTDLRKRIGEDEKRIGLLELENRDCNKRAELFEVRLRATEELLKVKAAAAVLVEHAEAAQVVAEVKQEAAELRTQIAKANGGGE